MKEGIEVITVDADEGSSGIVDELFGADDDGDDVYIDLDSLWADMRAPASPSEVAVLEDLSSINAPEGVQNSKDTFSLKAELPGSSKLSPLHNSEVLDSRTGSSDGLSESAGTSSVIVDAGMLDPSQFGFLEHSASRTVPDCTSIEENDHSYSRMVGGPWTTSSYDTMHSYGTSHVTHDGESSADIHTNHDKDLFGCSRSDVRCKKKDDVSVIDGDRTSQEASHTESSSYEINEGYDPYIKSQNDGMHLFGSDDQPNVSLSSGFQSLACEEGRTVNPMDEGGNYSNEFISIMPSVDVGEGEAQFGYQIPKGVTRSSVSLDNQVGSSYSNDMSTVHDEPYIFRKTGCDIKANKNVESVISDEEISRAYEIGDDIIRRKYYGGKNAASVASDEISRAYEITYDIIRRKYYGGKNVESVTSDEISRAHEIADDIIRRKFYGAASKLPSLRGRQWPLASVKKGMYHQKTEIGVSGLNSCYRPNIRYQGVQSSKVEHISLEDDNDVCILEHMSTPAVASNPVTLSGLYAASQVSTSTDPSEQMAMGHSRLRPDNERVIFQVAMQDLSQPNSEALPPDGALSVSLMKHQRIALSWMVNKETKGACCSGGILADDQGLGKTISTIALIVKERSPSCKASVAKMEQCKMEMCDLVEDNRAVETCYVEDSELNGVKSNLQTKGRPPAGTLIVCPTSVLRQWSEELHNKVSREADVSVLIYHGSNRTKNPLELAKYDVVITTYAIVSMEVPKQPVGDEKDDQFGNPKASSSDKKRKLHESASGKKSSRSKKSKKQISNELLETLSGPLAKVGWFRVVLDEAQTIKNHRTQVARACWGLRAKRRWCLSGTPIQNSIEDLYSYFRFLRHDPYATFSAFCHHIKSPIQSNPIVGYKKLQAVLKTIMLRRTKGTCIDGEPIINLPPKTIELKRIGFSLEEREFYCQLEANSQAQFQEYAKAGTVQQNYVNILLMLLRLRQACDHPLLVRGLSSSSNTTSTIEMTKKLPLEKSISLLNCLEASLAICGICNDPPEDAVVTLCGHVFCNQCICEHMIGNDSQCPTKDCKTRLTASDVFSITTIRDAISNNLNPNKRTLSCSVSDPAKVSDFCSSSFPEGSSKIKAALKLLTALSRPNDNAVTSSSLHGCVSVVKNETPEIKRPHDNAATPSFLHGCDSVVKNETPEIKNESHSSVKVYGEKAIVFSQWTRMLDLLEDHLKDSSIQYRRLDGTMPISARDKAVKDFTTLPEVSVMIMSLKAASLGLNLVAACHVILLDLWWNPTTEDQAIDRAHRIGQTRPVSVYRLTVEDTVEDRILALQEKKREMVASAFGEDEAGGRQTRLTVDDLKYLFRVN